MEASREAECSLTVKIPVVTVESITKFVLAQAECTYMDHFEQADALHTLLREIYLLLDEGDRELFARYGLTIPRYSALLHLGRQPGLSASELSDLMYCDRSNVTRLVRRLESEGLVTRRPHESDGRVLCIYLTEQGESLREEVRSAHLACNNKRFSQYLGGLDHERLLNSLRNLRESIQ